MDSKPDRRQKTNIMSGCPQHLDIQKELGWDLVLQGTSAGSWVRLPAYPKRDEKNSRRRLGEAASTSKENWEKFQKASRSWRAESVSSLEFLSPHSSTHSSLLLLTKWFENSVMESWASRCTGSWERWEFWLADDLNLQVYWTLTGWRKL